MKHIITRKPPVFSYMKLREMRHLETLGKKDWEIATIHKCSVADVNRVLGLENYSPSKQWKVPVVDFGKFEDVEGLK